MTTQTLPKDPDDAFCPACDLGDELQQIRIVIRGMTGTIPTALAARSMEPEGQRPH